jgi:membrane associated rhomboid family serine protease
MMNNQYSPAGFRFLPPVVKNLLIINGLFFLATMAFQTAYNLDLSNNLGLHYFKSEDFRPYQFVTYMFIHADFGHIFYNMFALWMFGYLLENVWGPKRFLTYYLLTGIGAAAIQTFVMWWHFSSVEATAILYSQAPSFDAFMVFVKHNFPQYEYNDTIKNFISSWSLSPENPMFLQQSVDYVGQLIKLRMDVPTIGASGAVFGILLAFGMMFPNMLVYLYFLVPIKAKWIVIAYGTWEIVSGISNNPSDNVAHFAHLGGMLFGFILILYWRKKQYLN